MYDKLLIWTVNLGLKIASTILSQVRRLSIIRNLVIRANQSKVKTLDIKTGSITLDDHGAHWYLFVATVTALLYLRAVNTAIIQLFELRKKRV